MKGFKTFLIVGAITLVLLAGLELVARQIEPVRAVDRMAHSVAAVVARMQPLEDLPSWDKDKRCTKSQPADTTRLQPARPTGLGSDLKQVSLESYYSPQSLMENAWSGNAFQPQNPSSIVAVFGASTIAGDGTACVEHTIPSQVQRLLIEKVPENLSVRLGTSPRVDNLGQSAFVSYNQFLLLVNLLRFGYRPRVVIFYQGHNDALQRVMSAAPHYSYGSYAIGATGLYTLRYALRDTLLARSALLRLLTGQPSRSSSLIVEGADHRASIFTGAYEDLVAEAKMAERAKATADDMVSQARLISALAQVYDFDLFVLSYPSVFSKDVAAASEAETVKFVRANSPAFEKAIVLTQNAMNDAFATPIPRVHYRDLRGCFGANSETLFKDISHISPRGNELLSQCVVSALAQARLQ